MRLVEIPYVTIISFALLSCKSRSSNTTTIVIPANSVFSKEVQTNGKWLPIHQLRDKSDFFPGTHEIPKPLDGWYVTPIQSNVLSDGSVLITGWSRPGESSCTDHQGRLNGTSFVINPEALLTKPKAPYNIVSLPEQPKVPGDVLYCSGHAPLEDGRVFFMGGARYKNLGDVEYPDPFTQREYGLPYARIFDPKTKTFGAVKENNPGDTAPPDASTWPTEPGGGLAYEPGMMWYPTNTRLPGGKILTNGGYAKWVSVLDSKKWDYLNKSVTIFDPAKQASAENPWTLWVKHNNSPREVGIDVFDYPKSFLLKKPVTLDGIERHVAIFGGIGWDPKDASYQPGITLLSLLWGLSRNRKYLTFHA